jgi:hypothetical protein
MGEETRITAELRESIDRSETAGEGISTRASLQRRDIHSEKIRCRAAAADFCRATCTAELCLIRLSPATTE